MKISVINGLYPYITCDVLEFLEDMHKVDMAAKEHERRRRENKRISRMLGYPARKAAEVFRNLFMDDARECVQYHSKEVRSDDGCTFYGYIEHDTKQDEWTVICLVNDPDNNSHDWSEPDWGMCGTGRTLKEAVDDLKKQDNYKWYPLLEAFG